MCGAVLSSPARHGAANATLPAAQETAAERMKRMSSRDDFAANLKTIFDRYDDDGSGEIDAEELLEIMRSLGVQVTEEVRHRAARPGRARSSPGSAGRLTARALRTQEIEVMVKEIDEDESGTIDFEEFKAMVRASPPAARAPRERSPRADPPRLAFGR